MTGFEPAASCSQSRRATNCATPGYLVFYPAGRIFPNQARYQLRYTRIFNFCHYTTTKGKIKDFSVCGHSCGQSRFYTAFSNQGKPRKRRRRKALRRFTLPCPGYRHGTPKAGALPTAQHPVMKLGDPAGRILPKTTRATSCATPREHFYYICSRRVRQVLNLGDDKEKNSIVKCNNFLLIFLYILSHHNKAVNIHSFVGSLL